MTRRIKLKTLNDYLKMDFKIIISTIPKDEGGGYNATIPQLGERLFQAYGDTPDEALNNLNEIKEIAFKEYIKKGLEIPEPVNETPEILSGKFMVRVPIALHRQLKSSAEDEGVSLNQFINYILSSKITINDMINRIDEMRKCFPAFNWNRVVNLQKNEDTNVDFRKTVNEFSKVS